MRAAHFSATIRLAAVVLLALPAHAQDGSVFEKRFQAIVSRPEYKHSTFGVQIYSLDQNKALFAWNAQQLFIPGSTTKILSVGTALESLGPDFRFHTNVYRTGPVENGALHGDLVLVASGDPNLSNRIRPDGTMVFENEDHSYDGFAGAKPVPGDPLAVIRELASKVAASGIRRIQGRVVVDASLFREGARELGTGVVISPIVVNDNLVDVMVTPGAREGDPAALAIAPVTSYVRIVNEVKTAAAGGKTRLVWANDTTGPAAEHSVTLTGSIAVGAPAKLRVYKAPQPSRYAEVVFREALESAGVAVEGTMNGEPAVPAKTLYTDENRVAEHISPPLREEAKVTLKVSQNLHASMMPYILGAYRRKDGVDSLQAGISPASRSTRISSKPCRFWAKTARWPRSSPIRRPPDTCSPRPERSAAPMRSEAA